MKKRLLILICILSLQSLHSQSADIYKDDYYRQKGGQSDVKYKTGKFEYSDLFRIYTVKGKIPKDYAKYYDSQGNLIYEGSWENGEESGEWKSTIINGHKVQSKVTIPIIIDNRIE